MPLKKKKKKKSLPKEKGTGVANSVLKSVNTVIFGIRTRICSIFIVDGRCHVHSLTEYYYS